MLVSCRKEHLRAKINSLLERTPSVLVLQAAWLILLFCASSRANFLLRALPSYVTHEFSFRHARSLRRCLSALLGAEVPEGIWTSRVCHCLWEGLAS